MDEGNHKRPTLRMVADRAGVSVATASYVFSGARDAGSGVAEATSERVLAAAAELHYRPNNAARSIRTGKTNTVQISVSLLSDPWSLATVEAINEEAQKAGLTALVLPSGDWYEALSRVECDAAYVGLAHDDEVSRQHLSELVNRGMRLVVFSETVEPAGFDVIRSDALPGCQLIMDHLLERHTAIACLTVEAMLDLSTPANRYGVYRERMAAAGLEIPPEFVATYLDDEESAFDAAVRLLSGPNRPTAIYTTTDFAGIAAIHAAHMLGLRVPEDVAITGVGNAPAAQRVTPTLTTAGPDNIFELQAQLVVARALETGATTPQEYDLPWSLRPGASTYIESIINS